MSVVQVDLTALGALTGVIINAQLALLGLGDLTGSTMLITQAQFNQLQAAGTATGQNLTRLVVGSDYVSPLGTLHVQISG